MAASQARKIPYPPRPDDVPEGLTDFPESFTRQQRLQLAGLFVFLSFYIGALLFCALIGIWCVWSLWHWFPLKIVGIVFSSLGFLFLVKGFFKRHSLNKDMNVELTEDEQPRLFEFIRKLCDEVGAPEPNKVFVAPDVNAMCIFRTSLLNLFVEPKKDLLIGLGLANATNLSEFKAVLAHEFGHFSHMGNTANYVHIVQRIMIDMIRGEDWFDRMVDWLKRSESLKALGYTIGGPLWLGRAVLWQAFRLIALQDMAVSREQEFHADLVAVSAAGSDATTHCLLRARFGMQCFMQALHDLATALDHKLYSNNMYLHQDRAAVIVRRRKKEPELGLPPELSHPTAGKTTRVFDAEQDELEDQDDTPPMWRSHPSDADREENVKERFVVAAIDHRSPWLLFTDMAELKERLTYKFYRHVFRIPKNADLADAIKVQQYIDNEHADTTYDPKYKGCYDDRPLEPGELDELNGIIRDTPWTEERMEKVLDKLYDGCEEHAEAHAELYKEEQSLRGGIVGRPSPKMKRKLEDIQKKQDDNWEWFKSFDRRVYLVHVQMAAQVDAATKEELVERYRFQLEVQRLYQESRNAFNKADAYLGAYAAAARGEINLGPDFPGEVIQVLRESWKALKKIIKDARAINLPAMKNFEEGERLADFILEGKMVPEPPLSYVRGVWIDKLMTQLQGVRQKCFRLHFKSVGGILALQEQIATKWKTSREPVAAEVVEEEVIPAEVIPAEVVVESLFDDVAPVEVVAAEVVPAEVIPDGVVVAVEIVPAEILPDVPASPPVGILPEPPKAMAAFVAHPTPVQVSPPELRSPAPPPLPAPAPEPEPVAAEVKPITPEPEPEPVAAEVVEPEPVAPVAEANPFDFGEPASPPLAPKPAAPEEIVPKAKMPDHATGDIFSLGADAAAPTVADAAFTLDADELPSPKPAPAPVKPTPTPAPAVPADDIFSLDGDDQTPATPAPAGDIFSLDADDHKPVAPRPSEPKPAEPKPPSAVVPSAAARTPAAPPATTPAKPPGSGVTATPSAKPSSGSGVKPALANGARVKRPPIKITLVKPGEKSPLAK